MPSEAASAHAPELSSWRPTPAEAAGLHRALDALESALAFSARAKAQMRRLEDRLLGMQTIAEAITDDPGSVDDRETACAKIELFAQQCDVLARAAVHDGVPVLEGGCFRFLDAGLEPALAVEVPNLRARGERSLGLFGDADEMMAKVGPGGAVSAGQAVDVVPSLDPDEPREALPPGAYSVELTFLALDASEVRLRLLDEAGQLAAPPVTVDLSADLDAEEVDLGVGISLILQRVERGQEVEIEHQTVQSLEWHHDAGERLESLEGWFHETVQQRDFELYGLYLEGPLKAVAKALEDVEAFEDRALKHAEGLLDRLGNAAPLELEDLRPGAPSWTLFRTERLPTDPGKTASDVGRYYLSHLHATAGAPDLIHRALEQAAQELNEGDSDSCAHRLSRVRQALCFDRGHGREAAGWASALLRAAHQARAGDAEAAAEVILPLRSASDAARPGALRGA